MLDYASVALVTLALPRPELPELSGFLVPAENGTAVKAATFFTTKWAHLRRPDGVALLRASVGRYGDEQVLQRDDAELAGIVHRELSNLVDHSLPKPVETKVQRWGGALPQYAPGHLDRVARGPGGAAPWRADARPGRRRLRRRRHPDLRTLRRGRGRRRARRPAGPATEPAERGWFA